MDNNQPNQVKSIIKVLDNYLSLNYGIHLAGGPGSPSVLVANQLEERLSRLKQENESLLRQSGHVRLILQDTLIRFLAARKEQLRGKQPVDVVEELLHELVARGHVLTDARPVPPPQTVPLDDMGTDDVSDPWYGPSGARASSEHAAKSGNADAKEPVFMQQYGNADSGAWFQSWRDILAIVVMVVLAVAVFAGVWKYLLSPFLTDSSTVPAQTTNLTVETGNTASLQATQERAESAVRLAEKSLDTAADAQARANKLSAEVAGLRKEVQTLASRGGANRARPTALRRPRILGPAKCPPGQIRFTDSSRRNQLPTYVCLGA